MDEISLIQELRRAQVLSTWRVDGGCAVLEGGLDKREKMMSLLVVEAMEAEKKARLVKMKKNDSK